MVAGICVNMSEVYTCSVCTFLCEGEYTSAYMQRPERMRGRGGWAVIL